MANLGPSYILSVDDDPLAQRMIQKSLSPLHPVRTARSAKEALEIIEQGKPGLVLLDSLMPEMDSLRFCSLLKKDSRNGGIPVIFLTSRGSEEDKARAFSAGAHDYLVKPVTQELLLRKVQSALQGSRPDADPPPAPRGSVEEMSPLVFGRFKEFLASRFPLQENLADKIASVAPSEIYSLAALFRIPNGQLPKCMAEFLQIPFRPRLCREDLLEGVLSAPFCRRFSVVAVKGGKSPMAFALSNPFDWELVDTLKKLFRPGPPLEFLVAEKGVLESLIPSQEEAQESQGSPGSPAFPAEAEKRVKPAYKINTDRLDEGESSYPILAFSNQILESAVLERASDIHIEPKEDSTLVRFRIDGDMRDFSTLDRDQGAMIVSRLKALASMDIAEKRRPQDGSLEALIQGKPYKLRLATTTTSNGESLIIRVLEPNRKTPSLEQLGMDPAQAAQMVQFARRNNGLILMVGPTGSGKTTTIYSLLSHIDCQSQSLISVEDPVEYRIPFANQQQVNSKAGISFEVLLKSAVRQDPDVLFIGEIRDPYSAKVALDFASTGHLTLTTLHTSNATTAIFRLERLEVSRESMADALLGIVAQRLVKKLCPSCKEVRPITPQEAKKIAPFTAQIPERIAHPRGCPRCSQTGYLGREGIQEVLHCDSAVADMIRSGQSIAEIRSFAHSRGVQLISDRAMDKIRNLTFSLDEVYEKVLVEESLFSAKKAMPAEPPAAPEEPQSSAPEKTQRPALSILVVEDDLITQKMITRFLESDGYRVEVANDGVDALLRMGQSRFDLLLADVNIPNLDGFKLLEMVQQKGFEIPVIMVTGRTQSADEAKGLELGASDYLKKPVSRELLLLRVRKALRNSPGPPKETGEKP